MNPLLFILLPLVLLAALLAFFLVLKKNRGSAGGQNQAATPPAATEKTIDRAALLQTYFKGLSYVLANENDKAVAEFVKVAKIDSTTAEIYLALGQLFRSTGEMERAIRVHRDILLRPNLPESVRRQTFFEIGLDYRKAGLLDRASRTFEEILAREPDHAAARRELSAIYEKSADWEKALALYSLPAAADAAPNLIAHLETEVAKLAVRDGDQERAQRHFHRALTINPACIDAWLHQGDFFLARGRLEEALASWDQAFILNPEFIALVIRRLAQAETAAAPRLIADFFDRHRQLYLDSERFKLVYTDWLIDQGELVKAATLLEAILPARQGDAEIFGLVGKLLEELKQDNDLSPERRDNLRDLIVDGFFSNRMRFEKPYRCRQCGYRLDDIVWKCPRCASWDTVEVLHKRPGSL
ncbi:MAG: tetratricopeptide repeat protein [Deltaproteobacteria bacterium]|nr:tetratricopeptide repeat protein [Deltaproteobacteria bacterium]